MRKHVRVFGLAVATCVFVAGVGMSVADAASTSLGAKVYQQEQTNWCWAAVSKSVINLYKGTNPSQCQVVKWGKASSSCPNNTGTLAQVNSALLGGGVGAGQVVTGSINFTTVRGEIDARRPVIVRWAWSAGGGHLLLAQGYDTSGSMLTYIDPTKSGYQIKSWSQMASGSNYTWSHSVYHIYR